MLPVSKQINRQRLEVSRTYSTRGVDILSEHYPLRFDHEEVDELLHIVEETLKRSLGDSEVLPGSHLGREPAAKCCLSSDLSGAGNTQSDVQSLEDVPDDVQVPCGKDEDDGGRKGDAGGPRILPAK